MKQQNSEKYKAYKEKDRLRKKKLSNDTQSGRPFSCKQPLGKTVARTAKSPTKKNQVIKSIVSSLSPISKNNLLTSMKKKLPF